MWILFLHRGEQLQSTAQVVLLNSAGGTVRHTFCSRRSRHGNTLSVFQVLGTTGALEALPRATSTLDVALLHGVASHTLHLTRQSLQDLGESEVELISTRDFFPMVQVVVTRRIDNSELLEVSPVFGLFKLDVPDLLELVVVDLDARE